MPSMTDEVPAPQVKVLMSTYRGEDFLDEQIRSVLGQTVGKITLEVRDDGSPDGTWSRLQAWRSHPQVRLRRGPNMGAKASFLTMLGELGRDADFVAFADQDDVWRPGHLEKAIERLAKAPGPALFACRSILTDRRLKPIGLTSDWPERPSFANALVENVARGGTMVLNRPAADLVAKGGVPDGAIMHDWWCYLVVSAFGSAVHDRVPRVFYRQHKGNLIGQRTSPLARLAARIERQFTQNTCQRLFDQAREFVRRYGSDDRLNADKRDLARDFADLAKAGAGWGDCLARCKRQFASDDALMRARFGAEFLLRTWPVKGAPRGRKRECWREKALPAGQGWSER